MKKMFRILMTLVMAVFMTAGLISPAYAESDTETTTETGIPKDTDTGTITVTNLDEDVVKVTAYQIVDAVYNDGGLSGYTVVDAIEKAFGYELTDLISGTINEKGEIDYKENAATELAERLTAIANKIANDGVEGLKAYKTVTADKLVKDQTNSTKKAVFEKMEIGEYLIIVETKNTTTIYNPMVASIYYSVSGTDNTTTHPVTVSAADDFKIDDSIVYMKKSTTTIDKQIVDPKDGYLAVKNNADGTVKTFEETDVVVTSEEVTDYGDDVAIGDLVQFKVTAAIPEYSDAYTDLTFVIKDVLDEGLTLQTGVTDSDGTNVLSTKEYQNRKLVDAAENGRPTVKVTVSYGDDEFKFYYSDLAVESDGAYFLVTHYEKSEDGTYKVAETSPKPALGKEETVKENVATFDAEMAELSGDQDYKKSDIMKVFEYFKADGSGFKFSFTDEFIKSHNLYNVTVEYSAQLNEKADVNINPNDNTATVEFTHSPDGSTSKETRITHTYTFEINGFVAGDDGSPKEEKNREVLKVYDAEKAMLDNGYYKLVDDADALGIGTLAQYHVKSVQNETTGEYENILYKVVKKADGTEEETKVENTDTVTYNPTELESDYYYGGRIKYKVEDGKLYQLNSDDATSENRFKLISDTELPDGWYISVDQHKTTDDEDYDYYIPADYYVDSGIVCRIVTENVTTEDPYMTASPLEGAVFTMYTDKDCTKPLTRRSTEQDGVMTPAEDVEEDYVVTATSGKDGRLIGFKGLDAGTYWFKETKAPDGYSVDDTPHKVDIVAAYNPDGTLAGYSITIDGEATSTYKATNYKTTTKTETGEDLKEYSYDVSEVDVNSIEFQERNQAALINNIRMPALPSTGGIGTYIFTIGGVAIMAAAILMFLMDRRSSQS